MDENRGTGLEANQGRSAAEEMAATETEEAALPADEPDPAPDQASTADDGAETGGDLERSEAAPERPMDEASVDEAGSDTGTSQAGSTADQGAPADGAAPEADAHTRELEARVEQLSGRLIQTMAGAAAARLGVTPERLTYALRMADLAGITAEDADIADKVEAAMRQVLTDVPELAGGLGSTGGTGNHRRSASGREDLMAASAQAMGLR